jgi:hypothetical protein
VGDSDLGIPLHFLSLDSTFLRMGGFSSLNTLFNLVSCNWRFVGRTVFRDLVLWVVWEALIPWVSGCSSRLIPHLFMMDD